MVGVSKMKAYKIKSKEWFLSFTRGKHFKTWECPVEGSGSNLYKEKFNELMLDFCDKIFHKHDPDLSRRGKSTLIIKDNNLSNSKDHWYFYEGWYDEIEFPVTTLKTKKIKGGFILNEGI